MLRPILLALAITGASIGSAAAEDAAAGPASPVLYAAQTAILALGALFTVMWAYQAFNAPPIRLDDGPTLPRYMTQPMQYQLGAFGFAGTCLAVYGVIVYFHQELFPLVKYISEPLYNVMQKSTSDGSLSYPLSVIFAGAIFVALLKFDKEWNPLLMLRRVIHGWVSIPQLANELIDLSRGELIVPQSARITVVNDPDAPNVALVDFDKDRRSLDRRWADLCYIRSWLKSYRRQDSHLTFFGEPSFGWERLQEEYARTAALVTPLKEGRVTDTHIFDDVAGKVDTLRRQYCRLAACFLVFKNETKKGALADARLFGVQVLPAIKRDNPLRYIWIYLVSVMVGVYVGIMLSASAWDLAHGYVDRAFSQDPDLATRWIGFALSNYGVAILVVLLLRYFRWRIDPTPPDSYMLSYAAIFLLSLSIAAPSLSLAVKYLASNNPISQLPFLKLVAAELKWSLSPAVVAVFVAHHVDRQIDPLLPDSRLTEQHSPAKRLLRCGCYALLAAAFVVEPALSIPLDTPGSVSQNGVWEAAKLRVVVLGTTFTVALVMASVGEFFLGKSRSFAQAIQDQRADEAHVGNGGGPAPHQNAA